MLARSIAALWGCCACALVARSNKIVLPLRAQEHSSINFQLYVSKVSCLCVNCVRDGRSKAKAKDLSRLKQDSNSDSNEAHRPERAAVAFEPKKLVCTESLRQGIGSSACSAAGWILFFFLSAPSTFFRACASYSFIIAPMNPLWLHGPSSEQPIASSDKIRLVLRPCHLVAVLVRIEVSVLA